MSDICPIEQPEDAVGHAERRSTSEFDVATPHFATKPGVLSVLSLVSSEGHFGIENMMVSLAKNLGSEGCRNIVVVFRDARNPHVEVADAARRIGLEVEVVTCRGRWDWSTVARIRELVGKYDAHILNPHGYKADFYAFLAARRTGIAVVSTCHNWPSKLLKMKMYAAFDRMILGRSQQVVVVSDRVRNVLLRSGVAANKVAMIDNGVDHEQFCNASPVLRREIGASQVPVVGFVGRHVADKGGALLLAAAKHVLTTQPLAKFVFVGDGEDRSAWEALAANLGIRESVHFAGVRTDMPEVYASFDLLVLPSLMESMPMCLLEAMSAAKAVIATRVGEVPRAIQDRQTGLLVEAGDVPALVTAIQQLLSDSALAQRLGRNACDHARRNFSAQAMAKKYIEIYKRIAQNPRSHVVTKAALELSC